MLRSALLATTAAGLLIAGPAAAASATPSHGGSGATGSTATSRTLRIALVKPVHTKPAHRAANAGKPTPTGSHHKTGQDEKERKGAHAKHRKQKSRSEGKHHKHHKHHHGPKRHHGDGNGGTGTGKGGNGKGGGSHGTGKGTGKGTKGTGKGTKTTKTPTLGVDAVTATRTAPATTAVTVQPAINTAVTHVGTVALPAPIAPIAHVARPVSKPASKPAARGSEAIAIYASNAVSSLPLPGGALLLALAGGLLALAMVLLGSGAGRRLLPEAMRVELMRANKNDIAG